MTTSGSGYFVTGGTLPTGSKSYVERKADRELLEALHAGEFCYILTARQMGKSSLMVRTASRLREQGVSVAVLDLTAIGQNVTPAQWYDGLAQRLGRQLRLEDEIDDYWLDQEKLGPCQRLFGALRDIALPRQKTSLVVFVDEIDAIRSLPFRPDEFFAAIRELYNRRTEDPELNRVTFCLLGVATPSDLIQDSRTTPFNIGRRIALSDFTPEEAEPLSEGLTHGLDNHVDMSIDEARQVLARILYWTGGQPFLTQRFCRAIKERNDAISDLEKKLRRRKDVDALCNDLFLSHRSRESDDNLALVRNRLLNSDVDRAALLDIYRRVHLGRHVDDDETSPAINRLRLAGIVRANQGRLLLRNRIYREVFDQKWIQASLPEPEKLRQRQAFRSGLRRGLVAGLVLLVGLLTLAYFAQESLREIGILRASSTIGSAYENLVRYHDTSEIHREVEMQGTKITYPSTNRFWLEPPDRLRIDVVMSLVADEMRLVMIRNGSNVWIHAPDSQTYLHKTVTNSLADTLDYFATASGANIEDTLYRFLAVREARIDPGTALRRESQGMQLLNQERLHKSSVNVFGWERRTLNSRREPTNAPISAWVEPLTGTVRRLRTDYTGIQTETFVGRNPTAIPMQKVVIDVTHLDPQINPPAFAPEIFRFEPPPQSKKVQNFTDLNRFRGTRPNRPDGRPNSRPDPQFSRNQSNRETVDPRPIIPPRSPGAERPLVDISQYYNASLSDSWLDPARKLDLVALGPGPHRIDGSDFDVRGILQLSGTSNPLWTNRFPRQLTGIPIQQRSRRLHFLHGTSGSAPLGSHVASFIIRYEDGHDRLIPVHYGYDVRDWLGHTSSEEAGRGLRPSWTGTNSVGIPIQLFHQLWWNPRSEVDIRSIDFVSVHPDSAPFLLAITVED